MKGKTEKNLQDNFFHQKNKILVFSPNNRKNEAPNECIMALPEMSPILMGFKLEIYERSNLKVIYERKKLEQ